MKLVRSVALSRGDAPAFLALHESEVRKLRQVPAWARWLFCELVGLSDFRTGAGRASYAQLGALLDFDAMPGRPPTGARVSREQVRRAVESLESLGIVARDKSRNEAAGALFFHLQPRTGLGASANSSARGSDRGASARKPKRAAGSEVAPVEVPRAVSTGVSGMVLSPISPNDESYPQVPEMTREARRALVDAVKARIAGGKIKAPPGAQDIAP